MLAVMSATLIAVNYSDKNTVSIARSVSSNVERYEACVLT